MFYQESQASVYAELSQLSAIMPKMFIYLVKIQKMDVLAILQ